MQAINDKQPGDSGYIAGYRGQKVAVYAAGLWPAKQAAIVFFKPAKKDAGTLWIELAQDAAGADVTHTPTA